jgi:hypothetical protein
MADTPIRRAGSKINGKWPSPFDGKGDAQNNPKGQMGPNESAGTYDNPNTAPALAPNPAAPGKDRFNEANEALMKRTKNKG